MDDTKTTQKEYDIRFEYIDEFGNYFEQRTRADSTYDMGTLIELGACFNNFLRQVSYPRQNDLLFMEDITEDEYDFLVTALDEYRDSRKDGAADDENMDEEDDYDE